MTTAYLTDSATGSTRRLAEQFGLTIAASLPEAGEYLLANSNDLNLRCAGGRGYIKTGFSGGVTQYRHTKGGGKLIVKVVNYTAQFTVWDATGDLERDNFVLASLGLSVYASERNPVVACLLSDDPTRVLQDDDIRDIAQYITLCFDGACALMPELALQAGRLDVVYLDSVYPERQKSAMTRKEMVYFHGLVSMLQDEVTLLATARIVARKCIVVKHPRLSVFLSGEESVYQYADRSIRFDVYLPFSPITKK